jgi:transcriptional regulator
MYTPRANVESDISTLRQFVRENPLCALITGTLHGLVASHIPVVLHEEGAGFGTLRGHVARANSQWQVFDTKAEALAIFTGPQHYISASWFPGKKVHGKETPTWNYVAVHIYGRLRCIEDSDWLLEHLTTLTDSNEMTMEVPWKVSDAPRDFIVKKFRGIVGLEMEVSRVEGKWNVNQSRNKEDAHGVMAGLERLATPAGETMSNLIRTRRSDLSTK